MPNEHEVRARTARIGAPWASALLAAASVAAAAGENLAVLRTLADPAGERVLFLAEPDRLELYNAGGTKLGETALPGQAHEAAFSPDGARLALSLQGGGLLLLDVPSLSQRRLEEAGACTGLRWAGGRLFYARTAWTGEGEARTESVSLSSFEPGTGAPGRLRTRDRAEGGRPRAEPPAKARPPRSPEPTVPAAPAKGPAPGR